ncbi:MAG: hypothetical protein AB7O67_21810 [Vicinamibacterales bacterium]
MTAAAPASDPPGFATVHLLMVHGVGDQHRLANLLRLYQSFRSNLTSPETPVEGEDLIPGWQLAAFKEGTTPPSLKLEPRVPPMPGAVGAVYLHEVNYAGFAGIIRENHRIDLTGLFLGLDQAVCAARQRGPAAGSASFGLDDAELARCLQGASTVLLAATVPVIGLPSILFRDYIGTFVATFTRFFEDVATFALDRNGEQLISAHLDRTVEAIAARMDPGAGDRLVIAAHSLGSVVAHNYVVRHWAAARKPLPDVLVTFGSPIGLLTWIWLFLDFEGMDVRRRIAADPYFCWNPVNRAAGATRRRLSWINVVHAVDPIATAFPLRALDLGAAEADLVAALDGGAVAHRFFGRAGPTAVASAHTSYLDDDAGCLRVLLRATGLAPGDPADEQGSRAPAAHWTASASALGWLHRSCHLAALVCIAVYGWMVEDAFEAPAAFWFVLPFVWPRWPIEVLAFWQRLLRGGPTKRIRTADIRALSWKSLVAVPYRLREVLLWWRRKARPVDPAAPGPGFVRRWIPTVVSFVPVPVLMALPVAGAAWLTGRWPAPSTVWDELTGARGLGGTVAFTLFIVFCAVHQLVGVWRDVVRLPKAPAAVAAGGATAMGGTTAV